MPATILFNSGSPTWRFCTDAERTVSGYQAWSDGADKGAAANTHAQFLSPAFTTGFPASAQSSQIFPDGALNSYRWLFGSAFTSVVSQTGGQTLDVAPFITGDAIVLYAQNATGPAPSFFNTTQLLFGCSPLVFYAGVGLETELGWVVNTAPAVGGVCAGRYDNSSLTNILAFNVPTLTSIVATSGPVAGGTVVILTGSEFYQFNHAITVTFGGAPATDVFILDYETIQCTTPAHAAGAVDVVATITYDDMTTEVRTLVNGFTYEAPPIEVAVDFSVVGVMGVAGAIAGLTPSLDLSATAAINSHLGSGLVIDVPAANRWELQRFAVRPTKQGGR